VNTLFYKFKHRIQFDPSGNGEKIQAGEIMGILQRPVDGLHRIFIARWWVMSSKLRPLLWCPIGIVGYFDDSTVLSLSFYGAGSDRV
jgi:hypothetical protein